MHATASGLKSAACEWLMLCKLHSKRQVILLLADLGMRLFVSRGKLSNDRFKVACICLQISSQCQFHAGSEHVVGVLDDVHSECAASCKTIGHELQVSQVQQTGCLVW